MTSLELNPISRIELEFNNSVGDVVTMLRGNRFYKRLVCDFLASAQVGNIVFFFGDQANIIRSFSRGVAVRSLIDNIQLSLLPERLYATEFILDQDHILPLESGRQVSIGVKDNFSNSTTPSQTMAANLIFISHLSTSYLHGSEVSEQDSQKSLVDRVNNALQMTQQYLRKVGYNSPDFLERLKHADERNLRNFANQLVSLNLN